MAKEEKNQNDQSVTEISGEALPPQIFDVGIMWSCDMAKVSNLYEIPNKEEGGVDNYVELQMLGYTKSLSVPDEMVPVYKRYVGKMIKVEKCPFDVKVKERTGELKVSFHLDPDKVTVLG